MAVKVLDSHLSEFGCHAATPHLGLVWPLQSLEKTLEESAMRDLEKTDSILLEIIEASLRELKDMDLTNDQIDWSHWYGRILESYFSGHIEWLKQLLNSTPEIRTHSHHSLVLLGKARLQIATASIDQTEFDLYRQQIMREENGLIQGELEIVLSVLTSYANLHEESFRALKKAAGHFRKAGAKKKEIAALMNALVEETCLYPQKRYIGDYLEIADKALAADDLQSVACCYYNISCEMKSLGALESALTYIQKAFTLLRNYIAGRLFYKSLAHRCDILAELGRQSEAQSDYESLLASPFPETKAEADVLREKHPDLARERHRPQMVKGILTPNWRARLGFGAQEKIGKLEEALILALLEKDQDRLELIHFLYGRQIDFHHAEDRFKNLLMRVRKKMPGTILLQNGKFTLKVDSALLSKIKTDIV